MKTLLPEIDSPDKRFHAGNPATGEQGTRVTDTWLNDVQDHVRDVQAEAHYVLTKAGFTPKNEQQTQLYQAIVKIIDDNRKSASVIQKGEVQLTSDTGLDSEELGLTAKAGKKLAQLIATVQLALNNYIPLNKRSSAVNSNDENNVATSKAVKTAYDLANSKQSPATTLAGYGIGNFKIENFVGDVNTLQIDGIYAVTQASRSQNLPVAGNGCHIQVIAGGDGRWCRQIAYIAYSTDMYERHQTSYQTDSWSAWKKLNTDGIPIGAVVSFPRAVTNPVGFLKANGTTFNQQTFPDLYRVLGNSNQLPDLTRSDVGMTAYFAVDNIPTGWIAFDEIATQVTEQRYPELYRHLVGKYGSIESVPKVADRFLRNAGNGLSVGQTQEDAIRNITGKHLGMHAGDIDEVFYRGDGTGVYHDGGTGRKGYIGFDASRVVPTANENRPKSLILKLCIKAINTFDDVIFWIKSHGEVTNAGALDAGRLAQGLQDKADLNHTHTVSQIRDFNQATSQIINAAITYQKIGDFEVRKYPDGTMIQTYFADFNDVGGYYSGIGGTGQKQLTWAVSFKEKPLVWGNITSSLEGSHDVGVNILTKSTGTTLYWYNYEHSNPNQGACRLQFLAIGRWK
ncbi:TPA: pyocin knob domain-containing protein [Haemophilus influenzae]